MFPPNMLNKNSPRFFKKFLPNITNKVRFVIKTIQTTSQCLIYYQRLCFSTEKNNLKPAHVWICSIFHCILSPNNWSGTFELVFGSLVFIDSYIYTYIRPWIIYHQERKKLSRNILNKYYSKDFTKTWKNPLWSPYQINYWVRDFTKYWF